MAMQGANNIAKVLLFPKNVWCI